MNAMYLIIVTIAFFLIAYRFYYSFIATKVAVLNDNNIKEVLLTGPLFSKVSSESGFRSFPDIRKLKDYLKSEQVSGYHILIKGSRGIALEQIYDLL